MGKNWAKISDNRIIEILGNFIADETDNEVTKIKTARREKYGSHIKISYGDKTREITLSMAIMELFRKNPLSNSDYLAIKNYLSTKCAGNIPGEEIDNVLRRICPDAEVWHKKYFESIKFWFRTKIQPIATRQEELKVPIGSLTSISKIESFLCSKNISDLLREKQKTKLMKEFRSYIDSTYLDALLAETGGKIKSKTVVVNTSFGKIEFPSGIEKLHEDYIPEILENSSPEAAFFVDMEKEKQAADKLVRKQIDLILNTDHHIELNSKVINLSEILPKEDILKFLQENWVQNVLDKSISKNRKGSVKTLYNLRSGKCFLENAYGKAEISITDGGEPCLITTTESKYSEKIRSYMENADIRKRIELFSEKLSKCGFSTVSSKPGKGILLGDTEFELRHNNGYKHIAKYYGNGLADSFESWSNDIISILTEAEKICVEKETKHTTELIKSFQKHIGDYLSYDIVDFVKKNNQYITPPAIEEALRGRKVSLGTNITTTPACGRYKMLEEGIIKERVYDLCDAGVLFSKEVKNTYGLWYNIIHVSKNTDLYLSQPLESRSSIEEIESKEERTSAETYGLWEAEKNPADMENNLRTIDLLRDYSFACRKTDEIIDYFLNAPSETTAYMKMLEDTEEDMTMKRILKRIRLDCAKQKKILRSSSRKKSE